MPFSLKLLGGIALAGAHGPVSGPAAQRHRLALLALLATARNRALSREKVMALLWPERETESARRLLNQAVHAIRQALGPESLVSAGEELHLETTLVACDVVQFEAAVAAGDLERAVALYGGPLLDGFFLDDAPEFERWVERERDRLAAACARALEALAGAAERAGNAGEAAARWQARAVLDPYDSRVALRAMRALEAAGSRAAAIQHALQHQQLLRRDLETEPDREVLALMERLRREPEPAPSHAQAGAGAPAPRSGPEGVENDGERVAPAGSAGRSGVLTWGSLALLGALLVGGAVRMALRSREPPTRDALGSQGSSVPVDELARAVARELDRRERGDTGRVPPEQRTRSLAAYELVLRGQDPVLIRSDSGSRLGLEYFRRAVMLDSTYAAAWVGLARLTLRAAPPRARQQALVEAEAAARRALALDDSLAEAHALLGVYRAMRQDFEAAEDHLRYALALEPGKARIREWYTALLLMTGRPAEALAEARHAVELDPLSPTANAELARALGANDRCEEALATLGRLKTVEPQPLRVAGIAARCYGRLGRWSEAISVLRAQVARDSGATLALLGYMTARVGQQEEAHAIQARLLERWRAGTGETTSLAFVPAGLGDRDEAFAWLERARSDGSLLFIPGLRVDWSEPPFDLLRDDVRLTRLRERLGLQKR